MGRLFNTGAIALALGLTAAAPAAAQGFEPNADMGYAFEAQSWAVPTGATSTGFGAFMHTLTLTDRTGIVMALVTSAAKTNANEYYAREDAKRRQEHFYQYQIHVDEPKEGARLSLILGTGSPAGLASVSQEPDAKLARMRFETDLTAFLGGTLALHTGLGYFQATGRDPAAGAFRFSSWNVPLGLYWRIAPLPVPGLVFEPFADLDWANAIGRGFQSVPAHDYGLRVAYYPHPTFALTARAELARFAADGSLVTAKNTLADARVGSLGAQLLF
ncbi:hypothetical protein D3C72_396280 [compost metagenome]